MMNVIRNRIGFSFVFTLLFVSFIQAQDWKIAANRITTEWAASVDPKNPLPEYPRPQMQRKDWTNLNGLWQYAITPVSVEKPTAYNGKILVPFAVESALSGVAKEVGKDNLLWYKTEFTAPKKLNDKKLLLHFGAVDWDCEVFINGKKVGAHKGGYDPFYFDITRHLKKGKQQLEVRVWDPSDDGPQPRGKQVKNPNGIWYTPVTGIWQTVWLETVSVSHIETVNPVADIDNNTIAIETAVSGAGAADEIKISIFDGTTAMGEQTIKPGAVARIQMDNVKRWSPATPFLYDLSVQLIRDGKVLDEVKSYFAMRKISMAPDKNGVQRMMLNNEIIFQFGMLDQGWWPDGLYTASTDEALQFDIVKAKEMGFNMLRKHVKVEPARWYYHCDKIGMLVWQDMPSGDMAKGDKWITNVAYEPVDKNRTGESEEIYRTELKAMIDSKRFFPCIVAWVPFNEAWGQFKTAEITKWIEDYDTTRLVNSASGGNFHFAGDMHDYHHYPQPVMHRADLLGKKQAIVLGEYGGLGLPMEGHTWQDKANWGYQTFKGVDSLTIQYSNFIDMIEAFIPRGLSAAIYTQVSDVEGEVNGLMTYDRKVIKIPVEKLNALHRKLYKPL